MKSVALDTNLLVLLVVGRVAPAFLGKHKRLQAYTGEDFNVLVNIFETGRDLVIIPQCVAEASNLVVQGLIDPLRTAVLEDLGVLIALSVEVQVSSAAAKEQIEYLRLGITDAAWLAGLNNETILLTDDRRLHMAASSRGIEAYSLSDLVGRDVVR